MQNGIASREGKKNLNEVKKKVFLKANNNIEMADILFFTLIGNH